MLVPYRRFPNDQTHTSSASSQLLSDAFLAKVGIMLVPYRRFPNDEIHTSSASSQLLSDAFLAKV